MLVNQISPYIHEYEFPYNNYLLSNLDYFLNLFSNGIEEASLRGSNNVLLKEGSIYEFLNTKLNNLITQHYYVDPPSFKHSIGIYVQTNESFTTNSHNHVTQSDISTVFYINPPQIGQGGEIIFYPTAYDDDPIKVQPQINRLYIFPSWMYHQPLPQTQTTPRVCLNWGYLSSIRPIHKITGDRW